MLHLCRGVLVCSLSSSLYRGWLDRRRVSLDPRLAAVRDYEQHLLDRRGDRATGLAPRDDLVRAHLGAVPSPVLPLRPRPRSEEHTSELQSLMRNSYAVFCLKKKKITHTQESIPYPRHMIVIHTTHHLLIPLLIKQPHQ